MGEGDEAESEEQTINVWEFCAGMTLWMQRERWWFEGRQLSFRTAIGGKNVFYFIDKIQSNSYLLKKIILIYFTVKL